MPADDPKRTWGVRRSSPRFLLRCMSPLLVLSGRPTTAAECPLLGAQCRHQKLNCDVCLWPLGRPVALSYALSNSRHMALQVEFWRRIVLPPVSREDAAMPTSNEYRQ